MNPVPLNLSDTGEGAGYFFFKARGSHIARISCVVPLAVPNCFSADLHGREG